MSEILDPSQHDRSNFQVYPDLGGTNFDYVKEVTRDTVTHFVRDKSSLTKLEIPSHNQFLHISVETPTGGLFTEAFYDFLGNLTSANIFFTRYFEQYVMTRKSGYSDELLEAYNSLQAEGEEIMFEANLPLQKMALVTCDLDSSADNIKSHFSGPINGIPIVPSYYRYFPDRNKGVPPVLFYGLHRDNVLHIGINLIGDKKVFETISTGINIDPLFGKTTPGGVKEVLEEVFMRKYYPPISP